MFSRPKKNSLSGVSAAGKSLFRGNSRASSNGTQRNRPNRAFFNRGNVWSKIMDGYSISGNFNFSSGGFATPSYSGTPQEIAAGAHGMRPNRVPRSEERRVGK